MSDFPLSTFGEIVFAKWNAVQLDRNIKRLQKEFPRKICRKALAELAKTSVKKIKATVPGRYRGVRKAIKWRHKKARYAKFGPEVKVGGGVGKQKKTSGDATSTKTRKGRAGVGIDSRNVHWWFFGTGTRTTGMKRKRVGRVKGKAVFSSVATGNPRRNRGKMPAQERPIITILTSASGELLAIVKRHIKQGVEQELK